MKKEDLSVESLEDHPLEEMPWYGKLLWTTMIVLPMVSVALFLSKS